MSKAQANPADYSLENFIRENGGVGSWKSPFDKVSERVLRIAVDGSIWLKPTAAIAYYGELKFQRLPTLKAKSLKTAALRELTPLARAEGKGELYCAYHGWHIRLVRLAGETVNISSEELLAFENSLDFEMFVVGEGISMTVGGKFATRLSGEGCLAIAVHGEPLVLPVTPAKPLSTDPQATVAWTETLKPTLKTDLTWRNLVGHGGGESFQMFFEGSGNVVIQPSEDPAKLTGKRVKKFFK